MFRLCLVATRIALPPPTDAGRPSGGLAADAHHLCPRELPFDQLVPLYLISFLPNLTYYIGVGVTHGVMLLGIDPPFLIYPCSCDLRTVTLGF